MNAATMLGGSLWIQDFGLAVWIVVPAVLIVVAYHGWKTGWLRETYKRPRSQ